MPRYMVNVSQEAEEELLGKLGDLMEEYGTRAIDYGPDRLTAAARRALDAIESNGLGPDDSTDDEYGNALDALREAIAVPLDALREAIA